MAEEERIEIEGEPEIDQVHETNSEERTEKAQGSSKDED